MKLLRKLNGIELPYHSLVFILSLYYATVMNIPLYRELTTIFHNLDAVNTGFVISIPIFFFLTFNILFSLFTWPKLTKPFFSLLIITSAFVFFASYNYGSIFDQDMIQNIMETNAGEASSYLSPFSVLWFAILGLMPTLLLWWVPLKKEKVMPFLAKKLGVIVFSGIGILIIAGLYFQDYSSVGRNNSYLRKMIIPTFYVHSADKYVMQTYFTKPIPYQHIGLDAKETKPITSSDKPRLVVFLLGETARSQNYQTNGYPRETTPYTKQYNVISFKHVSSCGTATALSVPCLFSRFDRHSYNARMAHNQDNLLDILKRAGIDVLWRENDGADKGVPQRVKMENIDRDSVHPLCNGSSCLDMALLNDFDKQVHQLQGNRFVVLHMIGSHGPTYFQRYPKDQAFFTPDCNRSDIENCTQQQIINTYDNTIRYTDYVMAQTIARLKKLSDQYNTALIYVSDHGESLGENGIYLHGMPYSLAPVYQTSVPMMVWLSDHFKQNENIDEPCLRKEAAQGKFSHDNIFDSVLGIMNVSTKLYRPKYDIFSSCKAITVRLAKN